MEVIEIVEREIEVIEVIERGPQGAGGVASAHANTHADGQSDSIQPFSGVRFNTVSPAAASIARMVWNDTEGTVTMLLKGGNVTLPLGQASIHRVYNQSGSQIARGKFVYIYGSQGQRLEVRLADNSSDITSARTFGITAEAIDNNSQGFVISEGLIEDVSTSGLASGTILWLGTSGGYTATRPTQPAHGVFLGAVVKGANPSNGSIFVKIVNGQELDEIHDVLITSASAGQVLARNNNNTLWINKTLSASDVGAAASIGSDDIEITDATKGLILKSANNTRWRITIDNFGSLTATPL